VPDGGVVVVDAQATGTHVVVVDAPVERRRNTRGISVWPLVKYLTKKKQK
jgi:hypothetical protein